MYKVLLLGSGNCKVRRIKTAKKLQDWSDSDVTRIDIDPNCKPDILMSLDGLGKRSLRYPFKKKLPFPDNHFDEIAAYDVIEHLGVQGDWKGYFLEFGEYHRVLKPGGELCVLVGNGMDNFADPGHTRFFSLNHFGMLNQAFYEKNIEMGTSCADYRHFWKKNFELTFDDVSGHHIAVIMVKA